MENYTIGQWIGNISGSNSGHILLNVEESSINKGVLILADDDARKPSLYANLKFTYDDDNFQGELSEFMAWDEWNNRLISWADFKKKYHLLENDKFPTKGEIVGKRSIVKTSKSSFNNIKGSWKTDAGTAGTFELFHTMGSAPIDAEEMTWENFKIKILEQRKPGLIYRGQSVASYKLRSLYHRQNKNNLPNYAKEKIPKLQHYINAESNYNYGLNDLNLDSDFLALLSLSQHHSYPTPLLDWTESPFVAAYFAFYEISKKDINGSVCIFIFDTEAWLSPGIHYRWQVKNLLDPKPSITILKAPALNNKRALPQQSVSTFTNIDDMEFFINFTRASEKRTEPYLRRICIPKSDRNKALSDLSLMNISHASLFPGLDGTCRALREKDF